jgi:thiamine kinase-like enzyme
MYPTLNSEDIKIELKENSLSKSTQDQVSCYFRNLLLENTDSISSSGLVTGTPSLRSFVSQEQLSRIDKSSQGITSIVSSNGIKAIMKYALQVNTKYRSNDDIYKETIHELIIGLFLNQLRERTPNFMYTYCGFFCHKPADEEKLEQYKHRMENYLMSKEEYEEYNKNAFRSELLCDESNKSHVLILNEYIEDSITLEKFLSSNFRNPQDITLVVLQILFSLWIANKEFGFVHNDLHGENILINKLNKEVEITYQLEGVTYSSQEVVLETIYVAHIIDYGYSQMTINEEDIINPSSEAKSKDSENEDFIMFKAMNGLSYESKMNKYLKDIFVQQSELDPNDENAGFKYFLSRVLVSLASGVDNKIKIK